MFKLFQILDGHTDYINALCYDPDKGEFLASVSDDLTCRIWDMDGGQTACLPLGSPGMDVAWHHEDSMKVLIGLHTNRAHKSRTTLQNKVRLQVLPEQFTQLLTHL